MRFFVAILVKSLMKVAVPPITFVVEYRAAHVRIRFGSCLGLFVLGFHKP